MHTLLARMTCTNAFLAAIFPFTFQGLVADYHTRDTSPEDLHQLSCMHVKYMRISIEKKCFLICVCANMPACMHSIQLFCFIQK